MVRWVGIWVRIGLGFVGPIVEKGCGGSYHKEGLAYVRGSHGLVLYKDLIHLVKLLG